MDKKNVLVFPGGTEIGLEICKSLQCCKDIKLFSAGSNVSNHAPFVFHNHFVIPDIHSVNWIEKLNEIIAAHAIDYIFPAYDDVILTLAQNSEKIEAKIITSPLTTCSICRLKSLTYEKFNGLLPVPVVYKTPSEINNFPVFVKPDKGQGSQDACKVQNERTLAILTENNPGLIIMEYLPGKEYTIDCFTDRSKGLLFCNGRERIRIKSGISMNSRPVDGAKQAEFRKMAEIISKELEFHGAWFFQLKEANSGFFKLLEIGPRISGTMATNRALGVNFPLLSIYESEGVKIDIMTNHYNLEIDRALINRYRHDISYTKVYVDLDDTLIINGEVNTNLIKFLYQAINQGSKVILITKTMNPIKSELKKWRIKDVFDEIIVLKKQQSKADFIDADGAIFIDDSFSERKAIYSKLNIPTFDCSMIELLIDERV